MSSIPLKVGSFRFDKNSRQKGGNQVKLHIIIAVLAISMIVIAALAMGYNTTLTTAGISAIVMLCTWEAKRVSDRRGTNSEAIVAGLKKAGYSDKFIRTVQTKIKGGK